jgi:hypothetical protein
MVPGSGVQTRAPRVWTQARPFSRRDSSLRRQVIARGLGPKVQRIARVVVAPGPCRSVRWLTRIHIILSGAEPGSLNSSRPWWGRSSVRDQELVRDLSPARSHMGQHLRASWRTIPPTRRQDEGRIDEHHDDDEEGSQTTTRGDDRPVGSGSRRAPHRRGFGDRPCSARNDLSTLDGEQ